MQNLNLAAPLSSRGHAAFLAAIAVVTLVLCLIVIPPAAEAGSDIDDQRIRAIAFDEPWNLYVRRLFGCPDTGEMNVQTCNPTLARTDYREFARAREQAKTLYQLRECEAEVCLVRPRKKQ